MTVSHVYKRKYVYVYSYLIIYMTRTKMFTETYIIYAEWSGYQDDGAKNGAEFLSEIWP